MDRRFTRGLGGEARIGVKKSFVFVRERIRLATNDVFLLCRGFGSEKEMRDHLAFALHRNGATLRDLEIVANTPRDLFGDLDGTCAPCDSIRLAMFTVSPHKS